MNRHYNWLPDEEADIYTAMEFALATAAGVTSNLQGTGYWAIRKHTGVVWESKDEVSVTPREDATHVVWYNK